MIPVMTAWAIYKLGAKNIKENSNGSVIPVRKDARAAENINVPTFFFLSGEAH